MLKKDSTLTIIGGANYLDLVSMGLQLTPSVDMISVNPLLIYDGSLMSNCTSLTTSRRPQCF